MCVSSVACGQSLDNSSCITSQRLRSADQKTSRIALYLYLAGGPNGKFPWAYGAKSLLFLGIAAPESMRSQHLPCRFHNSLVGPWWLPSLSCGRSSTSFEFGVPHSACALPLKPWVNQPRECTWAMTVKLTELASRRSLTVLHGQAFPRRIGKGLRIFGILTVLATLRWVASFFGMASGLMRFSRKRRHFNVGFAPRW